MLKSIPLALLIVAATAIPSMADNQSSSSGTQGQVNRTTNLTGQGNQAMGGLSTWTSGPQSTVWNRAGFGQLAGTPQPTVLDSFVKASGYNDMIYGDESTDGPPPYSDFLPIGAGITSSGLTTGNQMDAPNTDQVTAAMARISGPANDLVSGINYSGTAATPYNPNSAGSPVSGVNGIGAGQAVNNEQPAGVSNF